MPASAEFLVGITGGPGAGKSAVLGHLREAGHRVASADEMARDELASLGREAADAIGASYPFDRAALREALLASPAARRALNALLHPGVLRRMRASGADFIEVPLLVEAGLRPLFAEVWVATCGPAAQLRRLRRRLGDEGTARRLIACQLPDAAKVAFADRIIRTNLPHGRVKAYTLEAARAVLAQTVDIAGKSCYTPSNLNGPR